MILRARSSAASTMTRSCILAMATTPRLAWSGRSWLSGGNAAGSSAISASRASSRRARYVSHHSRPNDLPTSPLRGRFASQPSKRTDRAWRIRRWAAGLDQFRRLCCLPTGRDISLTYRSAALAVLRRSEQTRFTVCERRRSRRVPDAIRAERAKASEAIKHALRLRKLGDQHGWRVRNGCAVASLRQRLRS